MHSPMVYIVVVYAQHRALASSAWTNETTGEEQNCSFKSYIFKIIIHVFRIFYLVWIYPQKARGWPHIRWHEFSWYEPGCKIYQVKNKQSINYVCQLIESTTSSNCKLTSPLVWRTQLTEKGAQNSKPKQFFLISLVKALSRVQLDFLRGKTFDPWWGCCSWRTFVCSSLRWLV
jgi:hypothetical protein